MRHDAQWLIDLAPTATTSAVDGLVLVHGYQRDTRPPEEVIMMEKAKAYGAYAVFFEAGRDNRPPIAHAFVFVSDGPADDPTFGGLHRQLWNWGAYRCSIARRGGLVQLFRCAHRPDFVDRKGEIVCNPIKMLKMAG